MNEQQYMELMLRHSTTQTAMIWGILAGKIKGHELFDSIQDDVVSLCNETDEVLNLEKKREILK